MTHRIRDKHPQGQETGSRPLAGESVVDLYNRLRTHGASLPPIAKTIAAANRLFEQLLAAIDIWERARSRDVGAQAGIFDGELSRLADTLRALGDGVSELGGSPPTAPDTDFLDGGADIAWATDMAAVEAVLSALRGRLVSACADVGSSELVPDAMGAAVHRLATHLTAHAQ